MSEYAANRKFMQAHFVGPDQRQSDQAQGKPQPALQKPVPEGDHTLVELPAPDPGLLVKENIYQVILDRQSWRNYTDEALSLAELSTLLFCTQGVLRELGQGYASRRPVPSAGARHPFETYLAINRVEGLKPGLYRYLPFEDQLLYLESPENLESLLSAACLGQRFVGRAAAVFLWSCIPYRAEWRYMDRAHKHMLLDAGHICQNLYLAAEALGLGTCAIGAYDQTAVDAILELDGLDEYVVYLAPVGKI